MKSHGGSSPPIAVHSGDPVKAAATTWVRAASCHRHHRDWIDFRTSSHPVPSERVDEQCTSTRSVAPVRGKTSTSCSDAAKTNALGRDSSVPKPNSYGDKAKQPGQSAQRNTTVGTSNAPNLVAVAAGCKGGDNCWGEFLPLGRPDAADHANLAFLVPISRRKLRTPRSFGYQL
jgi:hypothetical protein